MNPLSIAAAYGVLVAVFQWGRGKELIGLHSTLPINPRTSTWWTAPRRSRPRASIRPSSRA